MLMRWWKPSVKISFSHGHEVRVVVTTTNINLAWEYKINVHREDIKMFRCLGKKIYSKYIV